MARLFPEADFLVGVVGEAMGCAIDAGACFGGLTTNCECSGGVAESSELMGKDELCVKDVLVVGTECPGSDVDDLMGDVACA